MPEMTSAHYIPRKNAGPSVLLDDPPLDHWQALIVKRLINLEPDAVVYPVLEGLCLETAVWINPGHIYDNVRKLLASGAIKNIGNRNIEGEPPMKVYQVTDAGRKALAATLEHHKALIAALEA